MTTIQRTDNKKLYDVVIRTHHDELTVCTNMRMHEATSLREGLMKRWQKEAFITFEGSHLCDTTHSVTLKCDHIQSILVCESLPEGFT